MAAPGRAGAPSFQYVQPTPQLLKSYHIVSSWFIYRAPPPTGLWTCQGQRLCLFHCQVSQVQGRLEMLLESWGNTMHFTLLSAPSDWDLKVMTDYYCLDGVQGRSEIREGGLVWCLKWVPCIEGGFPSSLSGDREWGGVVVMMGWG